MLVQLTPLECQILQHRLDDANALAEVFADNFDPEEVESSVAKLSAMVAATALDIHHLNGCDREVLIDCIEGSTFFVGDAFTPAQRLAAYRRHGNALRKKLVQALNRNIEMPSY